MVTKVSLFDGHSTNSENGTVGLEGAERGGGRGVDIFVLVCERLKKAQSR